MKKPVNRKRQRAARPPRPAPAPSPTQTSFPVIGIGTSAGGLEALEQFLRPVPPACGCAFVIVQHLDPNHKGMLAELLQRVTAMPVVQITDRTRITPNSVYVIPPNRDLSILHGVLHLLAKSKGPGLHLPIDSFLRSLAADQRERSLGVILSGMGSDGTLGLRAIKEQGGAVFVQAPASAKFDSMPRSAIAAGLADVVAPAEELAGSILAYLQHTPLLVARPDLELADAGPGDLGKVILLLRARTGHDFTHYKKNTLYRRIERRMGLHQLSKISDYIRYLRENVQEADLLFKELLIGVTSFFRDPAVWEQLKAEAIPAVLAAHPEGGVLRAWVTACSTGEEAYTLAITFREALKKVKPAASFALQIFATDLDKDAVDIARCGVYPLNIAADVSAARLRQYFVPDEHGYRVSKEIRGMVTFAPQNLVMDPPFTRLDVVTCRNLLIYLEAGLQQRILPLFHYSLNPGGILMLGSSETVGLANDLFTALPGKTRLYRRQEATPRSDRYELPSALVRPAMAAPLPTLQPSSVPNLQTQMEALLLQSLAPVAVLATSMGDIVYISGKPGRYLEPATGKANLNLFAMARDGLRGELGEAFAKAVRQNAVIERKNVPVAAGKSAYAVDLVIQPLADPIALRGMVLVVFTDAVTPPAGLVPGKTKQTTVQTTRVAELTHDLRHAREEMQLVREDMQASQEELKSANEELQSTNEELQSTNEELTTSKEEMQSMNEELQTVNHELQAKLDELSLASDDMKNLLNSTDIATLFLDEKLQVRRFTTQTTGIIKLIPGDIGRPITDLVSALDYPDLAEDAREVQRSLIFHECQVPALDGRWFSVRIMPYRTQDNRIDGVVITFVDISVTKALEATQSDALAALQIHDIDLTVQLDKAELLEQALRRAKSVLEKRFANQGQELRLAKAKPPSAKKS